MSAAADPGDVVGATVQADVAAVPTAAPDGGRRQLIVLIISQLLAGLGVASGVAVGGVLAEQLTGKVALAGLAQTSSVLGAGIWAIPLARLAERHGRRVGLGVGYALAVVGAGLIVAAAALTFVPLLFVGFGCFGAATAAGLQARFAATEVVGTAYRARAMSIVLWATTVGSVAGPNLSEVGARLGRRLGIEPLTGPYLFSLVGFAAAVVIIGLALHPRTDRTSPPQPATAVRPSRGLGVLESLRLVTSNRVTLLAVVAIACSHTVMVGVMVMTPVHMHGDGFSLDLIGLVISIHIIGMYGASPLFGWLTDKITPRGTILVAVVIFAAALTVAGSFPTAEIVPMSVALGLLGLGWSAGMIGGSTLLSDSVEPAVRRPVQGAADAVMNVAAAASAACSGLVLGWVGFPGLSVVAAVVLLPMVLLAIKVVEAGRPAAPESVPS